LGPIREFGSPIADSIEPVSYLEWQRAPDASFPRGGRHPKSGYLPRLTDTAVDTLLELTSTIRHRRQPSGCTACAEPPRACRSTPRHSPTVRHRTTC
jgi:hypothetical protein